jgi:PKD repeat protein
MRKSIIIFILLCLFITSNVTASSMIFDANQSANLYQSAVRNSTWATLHNATSSTYSYNTTGEIGIQADVASQSYWTIKRMGLIFNKTELIPDGANITSIVIRLKYSSVPNYSTLGLFDSHLTSFKPTSRFNIDTGNNFNKLGNDSYGTFPISTASANAVVNFTFTNGTLLSTHINKTGATTLGMRIEPDLYDNNASIPWVALCRTSMQILSADGSAPPRLYVYFDAAPESDFIANTTSGGYPLTVAFSDLSLYTPTVWNWSYKNATTGWTVFSTSASPIIAFPLGVYDINLTVNNSMGGSVNTKVGYITVSSVPGAAFSASPLFGLHPTVVFTNYSTNGPLTGCLWEFGDGDTTNNTLCDPVHKYNTNGTYIVNFRATNAIGSSWSNKTNYIYSYGLQHPITINASTVPGVVNSGNVTWIANRTATINLANAYMTDPFEKVNGSYAYAYRNPLTYFAYAYQITGNTTYANKTVDVLKNITTDQSPCNTNSLTTYFSDVGDFALGYDLIHITHGVNSTLDNINNTIIRENLANYADACYRNLNQSSNTYLVDYHSGVTYAWIGMSGEVLADYVNISMNSTPSQWSYLGGDGMWVNDPFHDYYSVSVSKENNGVMVEMANPYSGANTIGRYTLNYNAMIPRWANIWSNIHGQNYIDVYPRARLYALHYIWQPDPIGYFSSENTGATSTKPTLKMWFGLLNSSDLSYAKWADIRSDTVPFYYGFTSQAGHTTGEYVYSYNIGSGGPWYYWVQNIQAISPVVPPYISNLIRNGSLQTFRSDWSNNATWFRFLGYLDPMSTSNWRFNGGHVDQLTFELFALNNKIMSDGGEYGTEEMDSTGAGHNSILIDNGSVPFTTYGWKNANISYYAASRGASSTLNMTLPFMESKYLIQTPTVELMSFAINNISLENTSSYSMYTTNPITESRIIVYPFKDYIVVADRVQSNREFGYYNNFRFTSYDIIPNFTIPLEANQWYGLQRANGTLSVGKSVVDWNITNLSIETNLGVVANNITWNTTNYYKKVVTLDLFTSPSSNVSLLNYVSDITYGANGGTSITKNPQILFKPAFNKSLFRVTALLTRYDTDTQKSPSELTVTGSGSAIKINASNKAYSDYIYTGFGNNSFANVSTDAELVFIRKNTNITDYTAINVTYIMHDNKSIMNITNTRLDYIVYNKTGHNTSINISGHGSDYIKFNVTGNVSNVKLDGVAYNNYVMESGNHIINISLTFSDHIITYDESDSDSPPIASFNASVTNGTAPLTVLFTDTSSGSPFAWDWQANNVTGAMSWFPFDTVQNPTRIFGAGNWSIRLNVTNTVSSNMSTQVTFINVTGTNGTISAWKGNTDRVPIDIATFIFIGVILIMVFSIIGVVYKYILKNE